MKAAAQVIVVGAGPAGSTTAAALQSQGVDVLLVDKASFPRDKTCGDGLTPRAVTVLQELNLLARLEAAGALPITGLKICAPNGAHIEMSFDELDGNLPSFGLTLRRRLLDTILLQHARSVGVRFIGNFDVSNLICNNGRFAGIKGKVDGEPAAIAAPLTCLATGVAMPLIIKAGLLTRVPPVVRAARTYIEVPRQIEPMFQFHFKRQLLPGYGWIFPLAKKQANVGVGYFHRRLSRHRIAPRCQLGRHFLCQSPLLKATQISPIKAFPLRTNFPTQQTQTGGLLLVGEAAGLVNPITGEGVDYALESALMAAETICDASHRGDFSASRLSAYGQRLRERYLMLFRYLEKMRDWYIHEHMLNLIIRKAQHRPRLKLLFANAALGLIDPKEGVSLRTLADIIR